MFKRKALIMIAGAIAVAGLGGWALLRDAGRQEYRTAGAERGPIDATISATGTSNAVVTVLVGSQVSGNIKALYADFNTKVRKGQMVALIDPELFQAKVNQAQANVDNVQASVMNYTAQIQKAAADVSAAQANVEFARGNVAKSKVSVLDANSKLVRRRDAEAGVFAKEEIETAQATYDSNMAAQQAAEAQVRAAEDALRAAQAEQAVAKTQLSAAQAQVKQAQAALHQSAIDLEHTRIESPVDGTVVARRMDVGQTVAAGFQAPTLFEIAQDLAKMQVDTNVDEADIGRVQVGQETTFTVDAYPGVNFHGKVVEIRKAPINVQNVITYDAVVAVANPELKLFPGMTANVKVLVDHRDDVLKAPNAALRFRPQSAQNSSQPRQGTSSRKQPARTQTVWVLGDDGKPTAVPVMLGITDGVMTEITGGELKEGQQVIAGSVSEGTSGSAAAQPFGGGAGSRRGGPRF